MSALIDLSQNNYSHQSGIITLIITDLYTFFCLPQIAASLEKNLIPRLGNSPPDVEALRLYLTLPECPLFSDRNNYVTITIPFAKSLISLKEAPLKVLGRKQIIFLCFIPHDATISLDDICFFYLFSQNVWSCICIRKLVVYI